MGGLNYEGSPSGIIYGFLKSITAFQELFDTPHIIFCWDSQTNKRELVFPGYKQKRKDRVKEWTEEERVFEDEFRLQMKKLQINYLPRIGYKNIFCQEGYESDDIIASICEKNIGIKDTAIIISSDQDLYQCIRFNIFCYNPQKNERMTLQRFKKKYGILPDQWHLVKAIAGCSTDEVPGVEQVGEKRAIQYILNTIKKTTKAYQNIISKEGNKIIERNYKLVTLPLRGINQFSLQNDRISKEGWREVVEELGMKSLRNKTPQSKKGVAHEKRQLI